jgi:cytochrome d ubiquinol oxidase subunit I
MAFKGMVGLGLYFLFITIYGWFKRNRLSESRLYLKIMLFSIPLPYMAIELGWVMAEVGRQPWIVYGIMKTSDAVSPIASSQVLVSLIAFILVYGILGIAGFYLIVKNASKNPVL